LSNFKELFEKHKLEKESQDAKVVLTGQYKEAYEMLEDAEASGLTPALVGPPGVGKTLLCRYYAEQQNRPFYWITLDEATKPTHLIGGFDPAITIREGFTLDAFLPGPLLLAMLEGGYFLANELNRATEYTQNSFLEPLEERSINIPRLDRVKSDENFFMICAMNPAELAGTHRLSEALKDRIKVWIPLTYPDKSTELQIIRINCPEINLPEAVLEQIYQIINRTRNHPDVELPASLRAGIAIARLVSIKAGKSQKLNNRLLGNVARFVLRGSIKPRPGIESEVLCREIISQVTGI